MGRSQGYVQNGLQDVCTSTIVASPETLTPTLSTSSTMMAPKNTKEDHEPADNGDQNTPLISFTAHIRN